MGMSLLCVVDRESGRGRLTRQERVRCVADEHGVVPDHTGLHLHVQEVPQLDSVFCRLFQHVEDWWAKPLETIYKVLLVGTLIKTGRAWRCRENRQQEWPSQVHRGEMASLFLISPTSSLGKNPATFIIFPAEHGYMQILRSDPVTCTKTPDLSAKVAVSASASKSATGMRNR